MNDDRSPAGADVWVYRDCPLCQSPISEENSPPIPDRDGGLVDFRCCSTCLTLFPAGANQATNAGEETTRQAEYHQQLWADVNFEQLDFLAATASRLAQEIVEHLPEAERSDAIVDIGAGRGNIMHALARLGYPVIGCEPSTFLCQVARAAYLLEPDVLNNCEADGLLGRLEAASTPIAGYVIWHVLEHLRDPMALLRACRRLGPTSMLFIELPVAQDQDIFPEHLFFPTPRSLLKLAERLDASIEHLAVTDDHRLRVFYRMGETDRGDTSVGAMAEHDLDALEAAYRELSPAFAHFVPEPTPPIDPVERVKLRSVGAG